MKSKHKLLIFLFFIIIVVVVGLFISTNDFIDIKKENNDKVQKEINKEEQKKKQKPVLELTQDKVELEVGSSFQFQDFIKKAEDEDGFNLKDHVKIPKKIPTPDVPGEYQIIYSLELPTGEIISKQLVLSIVEYDKSNTPD